jgi:hypothetical protein
MARKAKSKSLYTVKVRYKVDEVPLVAYFTSQKEASEYEWQAAKAFGWDRVEVETPYMVYKTSAEALESLKLWSR